MAPSRRSSSRLWEIAFQKLFPKRAFQSRQSQNNVLPESSDCEHTDGFYMYSQNQLEEEAQQLEALQLQTSNSTEGSYSSAMAPVEPIRPYTVSSVDWILPSDSSYRASAVTLDDKIDDNGCNRVESVLNVFCKVYAIAKVMLVIFMHYGVDLDDSPTGILTRIKRAEEVVTSNSVTTLIETVDSLYYCVYARIMVELANVELCSCFGGTARQQPNAGFVLPEPGHLYRIYLACKEILDSPTVCSLLDKQVIWQNQDEFNRRAVARMLESDFFATDIFGYRRFTLAFLKDETTAYFQKWKGLCWLYRKPLRETQTNLSEKYLTTVPMAEIEEEFPTTALPFVDPSTVDSAAWEKEIILDHRTATLAKLEGKSLGQVRREETRRSLVNFCKEKKCICMPFCQCAETCTLEVERVCPCAERMLRGLLAKRRKGPGRVDLSIRCNSIAKVIFETFAAFLFEAHDSVLVTELDLSLSLIGAEVRKERTAAAQN